MHTSLSDQSNADESPYYLLLVDLEKCKEMLTPKSWSNGGSGLLLAIARRNASQTGDYYPSEDHSLLSERLKKIVKSIK